MIRQTVVGLILIMIAGFATAESGGLFIGRTVRPGVAPDMSVEAGYIKYGDGRQIGGRISKVLNDKVIGYADYSKIDADTELGALSLEFSGNSMGAGIFYLLPDKLDGRLPGMLDDYDVAAQLSYHKISTESTESYTGTVGNVGTRAAFEDDTTIIAASLVVSSLEPIHENGLLWYGSVGAERITNKITYSSATLADDSDVEFAASLGVVLPTEFGEVYGGMEYSDGAIYGVGARYHF